MGNQTEKFERTSIHLTKESDVDHVVDTLSGPVSEFQDLIKTDILGGRVYLLPKQSYLRVYCGDYCYAGFGCFIFDEGSGQYKRFRLFSKTIDLEVSLISILNRVHNKLGKTFFDETIGSRICYDKVCESG